MPHLTFGQKKTTPPKKTLWHNKMHGNHEHFKTAPPPDQTRHPGWPIFWWFSFAGQRLSVFLAFPLNWLCSRCKWNGSRVEMEPSQQPLFSALLAWFCFVLFHVAGALVVFTSVQTMQAEREITPPQNDAPQSIQVWKHQVEAGEDRRKKKEKLSEGLAVKQQHILFLFLFYTLFRK